ncbi:MAG TPA: glycosyltransferase [Candidatus Limnocylindrales bacterium]|nr:glycosyltransferase [Candidatus Limnocylindrales bacterium]
MSRPWLVLREGDRRRWGGDLRRHYLLDGLATATGGRVLEDRRVDPLSAALRELRAPRWQVWRRPPLVASTELLVDKQLAAVRRLGDAAVVDIHDDALLQNDALGIDTPADLASDIRARQAGNRDAFRVLVAPSRPFAELTGLDPDRVVVASNGSDTRTVRPGPWPEAPAIAFVSGAAPRRGIEELIAAARLVRERVADTRLHLWLAATGDDSRAYLDALTEIVSSDPWIEIGQAPYTELGARLAQATVLAIPTPAHAYWDSVAPVKLFDYLAAGRPVITTPRREIAAIVTASDAGAVAEADSAEAMAAAIASVLEDQSRAREMGANARAAAERDYDWQVIGARLAGEILARIR